MFPTTTPPDLEDYQLAYGELILGALTPYGALEIEGLDLAEIRSGDVGIPRDHGQFMGLDVYGGRDVIISVWMKANDESLQSSQLALAAVTTVKSNEEQPLWFKLPNLPVMCVMCRPRKRPMKIDSDYAAANIGQPEVQLHATDPRIYGAEQFHELAVVVNPAVKREREEHEAKVAREKTEDEAFAAEEAKYEAEIQSIEEELAEEEITDEEYEAKKKTIEEAWEAYKAGWKATRKTAEETEAAARKEAEEEEAEKKEYTPASVTLTNGNTEMRPFLVFTGPLKEPYAKNASLDATMTFVNPNSAETLKEGQELQVQLNIPRTYAGPEGNAADWLTPSSTIWDLGPGDNLIEFGSADEATGGTLAIYWAPANEL